MYVLLCKCSRVDLYCCNNVRAASIPVAPQVGNHYEIIYIHTAVVFMISANWFDLSVQILVQYSAAKFRRINCSVVNKSLYRQIRNFNYTSSIYRQRVHCIRTVNISYSQSTNQSNIYNFVYFTANNLSQESKTNKLTRLYLVSIINNNQSEINKICHKYNHLCKQIFPKIKTPI